MLKADLTSNEQLVGILDYHWGEAPATNGLKLWLAEELASP